MRCALFTLLLAPLAFAQEPPQRTFEAADVHASPDGASESGGYLPGGRLEFRATTLLHLISQAYSLPQDRIAGGPPWIDSDRFDVVAKAPGAANEAAMRTMLQALLAERFHLVVRQEEKPMPVWALVPGKGSRKEAKEGQPDCKRTNEENVLVLACHNITIAGLAERLPMTAPGYFGMPVVDRTGLKAAYDFKLSWLGRGQIPPGSEFSNSQSLYVSIESQLGIKVEKQTAPIPVLAIASVDRTPAPNPPGVLEKLGPPPTEFDVVDLKLSRPGEQPDFKESNGRIEAKVISLKEMIQFAYNAEEDDALKYTDKWIESDRYDIVAKTVPTASDDTFRVMVQSMLASRFGLKVHKDTQPSNVYALTAVKPKFKEADPSERSTCNFKNADGQRALVCTNVTMAQFAKNLHEAARGYVDHPVIDQTGLKGTYDLTAIWTPVGRLMGGPRPTAPSADGQPVASDRPVGLTAFEAIDKQLGLKLSAQKHPMPVIVIDHIDRKPTEN